MRYKGAHLNRVCLSPRVCLSSQYQWHIICLLVVYKSAKYWITSFTKTGIIIREGWFKWLAGSSIVLTLMLDQSMYVTNVCPSH